MEQTRSHRFDHALLINQVSARLTGWVLGTGLLVFHAGLFFLTMTGLMFWNAYDNPSDFWVGSLLRRWGAVLVLHAIVTAAVTIGWRLLRSADIQEAAQANWTTATPQRMRMAVTDARWRMLEAGRPAESAPFVPASEPELPNLSAGQRLRVRAERRLAALRGKADDVPADVAASWPEPPARRGPDEDELIRQFGAGEPSEIAPAPAPGSKSHARWSWVEAAATTWATRRESPDDETPDRRPRVAPPSPPPSFSDDDDSMPSY